MTIERRNGIISMKEALKINNERVFSEFDKAERLNKIDNLRKILY